MTRTRLQMFAGAGVVAGLCAILFVLTRTLQTITAIGEAFLLGSPAVIESNDDSGTKQSADTPAVPAPPQRPARDEPARAQISRPATETPQLVEDLKSGAPIFAGLIEKSEAELAIEDKDPAWAPTMEARILAEISRKALGLELTYLQVDCRTSLCRVEMVFPQQLLQKKFGNVPKGTPWTGQQPVGFFLDALDLEFREPVPSGLDRYGAPVVIAYVPKSQTREAE